MPFPNTRHSLVSIHNLSPPAQDKTVLEALMNICGPQVAAALHGGSSTLIVIHDSLEHKPLTLSPKFGGSAGGHNGVRSIISALGNDSQFHRLPAQRRQGAACTAAPPSIPLGSTLASRACT
ncbi:hypothetical protein NEOLEDRAFT_1137859 [Neolentinus lepideus HHB14362 ss-1]|uniref:Peptidyl-tRNA hydrolase n=1 Tax=Neolentinus lepideus HHB14362 ss-1 TaxID=1314782 RepID=A0A165QM05_9AGAM|nr:hypothetical protein NEOLEDRAFT_1137859 [Neolentinus lepideus HHB14362 ss-1]